MSFSGYVTRQDEKTNDNGCTVSRMRKERWCPLHAQSFSAAEKIYLEVSINRRSCVSFGSRERHNGIGYRCWLLVNSECSGLCHTVLRSVSYIAGWACWFDEMEMHISMCADRGLAWFWCRLCCVRACVLRLPLFFFFFSISRHAHVCLMFLLGFG